MRFDTLLIIAGALFLLYAFFHDAMAVEQMWERFLRLVAVSAIWN